MLQRLHSSSLAGPNDIARELNRIIVIINDLSAGNMPDALRSVPQQSEETKHQIQAIIVHLANLTEEIEKIKDWIINHESQAVRKAAKKAKG
jgi:hypothetical protein